MNEWPHPETESAGLATEEIQLASVEGVVVSIVGAPEAARPRETEATLSAPEAETAPALEAESAPTAAAIEPHEPSEPLLDLISFDEPLDLTGVVPQTIILGGGHASPPTPEPSSSTPPAGQPNGHLGHLAHHYEVQITGAAA